MRVGRYSQYLRHALRISRFLLRKMPANSNIFLHSLQLCEKIIYTERTPNADLSQDCVGQRCHGWMDIYLGTRIWHPAQIFLQRPWMASQGREPGIEVIKITP